MRKLQLFASKRFNDLYFSCCMMIIGPMDLQRRLYHEYDYRKKEIFPWLFTEASALGLGITLGKEHSGSSNVFWWRVSYDCYYKLRSIFPVIVVSASIMELTSRAVAMHIVTSARTISWLQQLHTQYFQIYLYDPVELGLYNRSVQLMNRTSFSPHISLQNLHSRNCTCHFFRITIIPRKYSC